MVSAWHVCILELSLEEHSAGPLLDRNRHLLCLKKNHVGFCLLLCSSTKDDDHDDTRSPGWLCVTDPPVRASRGGHSPGWLCCSLIFCSSKSKCCSSVNKKKTYLYIYCEILNATPMQTTWTLPKACRW